LIARIKYANAGNYKSGLAQSELFLLRVLVYRVKSPNHDLL